MDLAITATLRPEILEQTLQSFKDNLFGSYDSHQLVINIDPIGTGTIPETLGVCEKYFNGRKKINIPPKPCFPKAFKWVWKECETWLTMQTEDDWILTRPQSLEKMIAIMENNPNLAVLRFPRWAAGEETCRQWNKHFLWNGQFFECPKHLRPYVGYSGNPALIRSGFVKSLLPYIPKYMCPEKAISGGGARVRHIVSAWNYGVFAEPFDLVGVKDIGEAWRIEHGFKKQDKVRFTTWTR
jgi:hypothetical protein